MKKFIYMALLIVTTLFVCVNCKEQQPAPKTGLVTTKAMVVSARAEASEIAVEILKKGGNAFDAMIATEMALAVAYPTAGNIGGGGFMVYRQTNGEIGALDYREKAPLVSHKNMYLDSLGNVISGMSLEGATAVGVPGTVAGVMAVHERFGKLPLSLIFEPVIKLAENGVVVTKKQAISLNDFREDFIRVSGDSTKFAQQFVEGDTIKYPNLAETLKTIAKNGKSGFYEGEVARKLVKFLQEKGGYITENDLLSYEAKWREPVVFNFKDLKVISMSPPSSGGITLNQIFKMIEPYDMKTYGHNSVKAIQVFTEAARRAYADRNFFLGDPDFVDIPKRELLDQEYLKNRMSSFSFEKATKSSEVSHGSIEVVESPQTTHYSIVDAEGNAVSVTTTLNGAYGSKLFCDELGFFLNNEMDDFSAKPGVPNMFGLVGGDANCIAAEKRMLSSMTPTIVEKDGKLSMVIGTPGGSSIITAVAQTILNVYEFDMSMQDAVDAPRFHHQWLPDEIIMEPNGFGQETTSILKEKEYKINEKDNPIVTKVDAILVRVDGTLEGGADKRGDDTAVGY